MNPLPILRALREAAPFKPFAVCLTDGRKLPVLSRDHLTITAQGRILWEGDSEEEFAVAMPLHVTGYENLRPKRGAKR